MNNVRSFLNRVRRITNQRVLRPFYRDAGDWRNTVFLAGVGRSGTTWIQNLINSDGSYRIMFEPFYRLKTPLIADWHEHQYLHPENREPRYLQPATRILSGQIRSLWVDKFNTKRFVRKRLIKDIRTCLILNWIHRHFPPIPIILVIRNPFAVVHSQLRAGWDLNLNDYLDQDPLMQDHLGPFESVIRGARTPFDRNLVRWCVENFVPLRQFRPGQMLVVTYEDCCRTPDFVNRQLCQFLNRPYTPLSDRAISSPSPATKAESAINTGGSLLRGANQMFDAGQVGRGLKILDLFGLRSIYDESPVPRIPADQILPLPVESDRSGP